MGDGTGISWTDATWNPVRGCSRVSEGCRHCYAERVAARFSGPGQPYEGLARYKLTIVNSEEHDADNRRESRWTGSVRFVAEHLADPLRWRKPRRIFVNSMSDLFHERLTNEQIAAVFGVMAAAPHHTFQVLTKRAKRMREWFAWVGSQGSESRWHGAVLTCARRAFDYLEWDSRLNRETEHRGWPLPNVWLGVSVEDQAAADERVPELLATPAVVRFLSCEPLIGAVDLTHRSPNRALIGATARRVFRDAGGIDEPGIPGHLKPPPSINWMIAGCESGPSARPCDVAWLRSLRDQCASAAVPFFLKQSVAVRLTGAVIAGPGSKRKAGGVIELPYLDGVQHAAFPRSP
jgi:protein gp37